MDTEVILNTFLYWLRDNGWVKDDLLDQSVDITVSDFVHRDNGFQYRATHESVHDGSNAMLKEYVTHGGINLVNEDGESWIDPAEDWKPID